MILPVTARMATVVKVQLTALIVRPAFWFPPAGGGLGVNIAEKIKDSSRTVFENEMILPVQGESFFWTVDNSHVYKYGQTECLRSWSIYLSGIQKIILGECQQVQRHHIARFVSTSSRT